MKKEQDYFQDIVEIRSMMERSSKFLSLSGLAGVMAGIYALIGAYFASESLKFSPKTAMYSTDGSIQYNLQIVCLGLVILSLAVATAVLLCQKKAAKRGDKLWNPTARRLVMTMAVPLISGGLLTLILFSKNLLGLVAPCTLIFYGLALYNAGKFTFEEVKSLGLIQIVLGLLGSYFIEYSLLLWALGFGVSHIIYGIYMHYRYEK